MAWQWASVFELLARGEPLFRFIHGLAFFVLGVVLLLLVPRSARLRVARRLSLLAVFGFCEAVATWDGALAPIEGLECLLPSLVRTLVAGAGYAALLSFGLLAAASSGRRYRVRVGLAVLFPGLWLAGLAAAMLAGAQADQVARWGDLVSRLWLALPGGVIAALELRREADLSMDPPILGRARSYLRVAEASLAVFGALSALQVASSALGAPLAILYALCGALLTWGLMQTLNVIQREIERWIEGVEHSQALVADRERISRDLHDGIIQSIYAAGLMLEGVRQAIPVDPEAAQAQLSRAMESLNQSIRDTRRYIFDLRGGVPGADLHAGLEELLRDFRVNTFLETEMKVQGEETRVLGAERRAHVFHIVREALSNTARHARARKVSLLLAFAPDALRLRISDDGVGMSHSTVPSGQGLRNIRERTRLLDGTLDIDSAPGQGVTVTITVPY